MQRRSWGVDPWQPSPWTPGSWGSNDSGSPFTDLDGPTPGPWGINDGSPGHCILGMTNVLTSEPEKEEPEPGKNDPIRTAYDRADQEGWIPYFRQSAEDYSFKPELLMAIGYRETNLLPKYLKEAGDNGNGYGLLQIDIGSYPDWVASGAWKNAEKCIDKGAEVLSSKLDEIKTSIGKTVKVKTKAGVEYEFEGKLIAGADLLRVAIAAYNCGMWAYYHYSKGHNVDIGTTGQDYSKDVLVKTAKFKPLLVRKTGDFPKSPGPASAPKGSGLA